MTQLLIKWSGWHATLANWEDEVDIKQKFPFAPAWGQAGHQGREDVSDLEDGSISTMGARNKNREEVKKTLLGQVRRAFRGAKGHYDPTSAS